MRRIFFFACVLVLAGCAKNTHQEEPENETGMFGSTVKRVRKALPAIYAGASVHLDGLNIVFTLEAKNPMGYDSAMFRHVWVDPIVRRTKWLGFTNLRTGKLYQDWFLVNLVYKVETPTVSGLTNQVFHYRFIDPNIKEPGDWWW